MKENTFWRTIQWKHLTLEAKGTWDSFIDLIRIFCWTGIEVERPTLKVKVKMKYIKNKIKKKIKKNIVNKAKQFKILPKYSL